MKRAKLSLKKESLRSLTNESLGSVGGGVVFTTFCRGGGQVVNTVWVPALPVLTNQPIIVVGP